MFEAIKDFLWDWLLDYGERLATAVTRAWDDYIDQVQRAFAATDWINWPFLIASLAFSALLLLDNIITNIVDAMRDALINQIRLRIVAPKNFSYSVMTREEAFNTVRDVILLHGVDAIGLRGQYAVQLQAWLIYKARFLKLLKIPTVLTIVTGAFRRVFWRAFLRIFRIALLFIEVLTLGALAIVLVTFLGMVERGEILQPLQQFTKRKKVRTAEGVIYRREPGGNPP